MTYSEKIKDSKSNFYSNSERYNTAINYLLTNDSEMGDEREQECLLWYIIT